MKTVFTIVGALVTAGLIGLVGWFSYFTVHREGRLETTRDFCGNAAGASLMSARAAKAQPQLRQYAKAQYYYYSSMVDQSNPEDLGPVDESQLEGLEPFIRHADAPNDYYHKSPLVEEHKRLEAEAAAVYNRERELTRDIDTMKETVAELKANVAVLDAEDKKMVEEWRKLKSRWERETAGMSYEEPSGSISDKFGRLTKWIDELLQENQNLKRKLEATEK